MTKINRFFRNAIVLETKASEFQDAAKQYQTKYAELEYELAKSKAKLNGTIDTLIIMLDIKTDEISEKEEQIVKLEACAHAKDLEILQLKAKLYDLEHK